MPFFKRDDEASALLTAPNFVAGPGFELQAEMHDTYSYPVDGWYWFDSLDAAMVALAVPPAATSITQRQARLYLFQHGLLAGVEAALDQLAEPVRTAALIEWQFAREIERTNPLVLAIVGTLGWTDDQVDTFFAEAGVL